LTQTSAAIPQKRLIKKPLFHNEIENGNNNNNNNSNNNNNNLYIFSLYFYTA